MTDVVSVRQLYDITGRVAVITGGSGMLGIKHAEAIAEMGGIPVLLDIDGEKAVAGATEIRKRFKVQALGLQADVTDAKAVVGALAKTLDAFVRVDILINNAANNPQVDGRTPPDDQWSRLENFPREVWDQDIAVGLTGAFLCSKIIGSEMATRGQGVILNIASDLALIAPDQRIYHQAELPEDLQPVKPVSYAVVKAGLLGLTRYLATYWAEKGVRVNAISPGGVFSNQDSEFVRRLTQLIPLGRMAHQDEYKAAIIFLVSDASSYMTGANLIIDGGRTAW